MRIINVSKYNAHTDPLFKNTKLLKIEGILKLNELKFYYKFENGSLPNYFKKRQELEMENGMYERHFVLSQNNEVHQHNTRHKNKMHITRINHKYANKCLRYNIPYTINSTPKHILDQIHTHTIQSFASSI